MKYLLLFFCVFSSCVSESNEAMNKNRCHVQDIDLVTVDGYSADSLISESYKYKKYRRKYPNSIPLGYSLEKTTKESPYSLSFTHPEKFSYCPECEKSMLSSLGKE